MINKNYEEIDIPLETIRQIQKDTRKSVVPKPPAVIPVFNQQVTNIIVQDKIGEGNFGTTINYLTS